MTPSVRSVFDVIYDSPWHHPMVCFVAAPFIFWALLRARPRAGAAPAAMTLWRLMLLCQVLIVADALCTGAWSPLASGSSAATGLAVAFVVLGDLRYFLLLERFAPTAKSRTGMAWLGRALGLGVLIPAVSGLLSALAPNLLAEPRRQFLTYEVMFLALLLVLRAVVLPARLAAPGLRSGSAAVGPWLWRLFAFEVLQYGLWVLADAIILAGAPAGLLLRLVPNLLYYVAFVPFAYFTAPRSLRQPGRAR